MAAWLDELRRICTTLEQQGNHGVTRDTATGGGSDITPFLSNGRHA